MSEIQRYRDTEKQIPRDSDDTEGTKDVPRLAASVSTLQDAAQLSLQDSVNENSLFTFTRALKAFEITTRHHLSRSDLNQAFSLWWSMAKEKQLPENAVFDEYRLDFLVKFEAIKAALGANSLEERQYVALTPVNFRRRPNDTVVPKSDGSSPYALICRFYKVVVRFS